MLSAAYITMIPEFDDGVYYIWSIWRDEGLYDVLGMLYICEYNEPILDILD